MSQFTKYALLDSNQKAQNFKLEMSYGISNLELEILCLLSPKRQNS